jgi:phosphohistidine phosphatase
MRIDLYLVRHAEAIQRGSLEVDEHRWLTERGRRRFYKAARRLREALRKEARQEGKKMKSPSGGRLALVEAVLTSPLPRAVMTAELLHRALRLRGPLEVAPELSPGTLVPAAAALLRRQGRVVAAVGHEPMLSDLVLELTGERLPMEVPKGGVVRLRVDPDNPGEKALLKFVLAP